MRNVISKMLIGLGIVALVATSLASIKQMQIAEGALEALEIVMAENAVLTERIENTERNAPSLSGGYAIPVGAPKGFPIEINENTRITSPWGIRTGVFSPGRTEFHMGTDVANNYRGVVLASGGGRVITMWHSPGDTHWHRPGPMPEGFWQGHDLYGGYIVIDHGNGWVSMYAHLSETFVEDGDIVIEGQPLGRQGATGIADGIHLHYELWYNDEAKDPMDYWEGVAVDRDGYIREVKVTP